MIAPRKRCISSYPAKKQVYAITAWYSDTPSRAIARSEREYITNTRYDRIQPEVFRKRRKEMSVVTKNEICPYVQSPFDDCYCYNLTSRYIKSAIYYCGSHFRTCEIYKRNTSGKHRHIGHKAHSPNVN